MRHYLANLFQLLLSPGNGWEDVSRLGQRPSQIARQGYFPLSALAGASVLLSWIYHGGVSAWSVCMRAVLTFVMFFLSYFVGTFVMSVALAPCVDGRPSMMRAQTFVLYTLGLLALLTLVVYCLPMTAVILFFMPIYVAIIMWKAVRYLKIRPERVGAFMLTAICGVMLPPLLIYMFFSMFI